MDRWSQLSIKDKSDLMSLYIRNGISSLEEIKKHYNSFADGGRVDNNPDKDPVLKDRKPKANFYQRLLDANRQTILDWENRVNNQNNVATHKMSWATDDDGTAIVYPEVQEIDGKLYDFTDPRNKESRRAALDRAIQTGDTIQMTPEQANFWTQHYKEFYPSFNYANGGYLDYTTSINQLEYPYDLTTVPSNNIAIKEDDYPILGINDLGNTTVMQSNNDYTFKDNYITESNANFLTTMPAPLPPNPVVPLDWNYMTKNNASGYKDMQDIWNYMINKGVSERNAAALMGNIMQESSFDPNKVQKGGDKAVGYFQMHGDKLKSYNNWLKANKKTHSNYTQVDYILDLLAGNVEDPYMKEYDRINDTINNLEAKKTLAKWEQKQLQEYKQEYSKRYAKRVKEGRLYPYSQMIEMFNNPDLSIEDITDIFTNSYERAGKPEHKQRQQYARDIYERFKTKKKAKNKK